MYLHWSTAINQCARPHPHTYPSTHPRAPVTLHEIHSALLLSLFLFLGDLFMAPGYYIGKDIFSCLEFLYIIHEFCPFFSFLSLSWWYERSSAFAATTTTRFPRWRWAIRPWCGHKAIPLSSHCMRFFLTFFISYFTITNTWTISLT